MESTYIPAIALRVKAGGPTFEIINIKYSIGSLFYAKKQLANQKKGRNIRKKNPSRIELNERLTMSPGK